jgi:hypothetical protein
VVVWVKVGWWGEGQRGGEVVEKVYKVGCGLRKEEDQWARNKSRG